LTNRKIIRERRKTTMKRHLIRKVGFVVLLMFLSSCASLPLPHIKKKEPKKIKLLFTANTRGHIYPSG